MAKLIISKSIKIKSPHDFYKLIREYKTSDIDLIKFKDFMNAFYTCFCNEENENKATNIYKSLNKINPDTIKDIKHFLKCDKLILNLYNNHLYDL